MRLIASDCFPHQVSPEAWRKELMLPKERRNGAQAKAAARLVARQVRIASDDPKLPLMTSDDIKLPLMASDCDSLPPRARWRAR